LLFEISVSVLNEEAAYDLTLYIMIGSVILARAAFELVYNYKDFFQNPISFFYFWQGGMSFHGGVIGGALAGLYYCRKKKIDFYDIGDIVALPLALMLGFGRIANFLNGELVGTVTNVPWCVDFGDGLCRHPSQLYEAAKIDGATAWQRFRNVTLPLIRPVMIPAITLGIVWTFNNLNIVWLVSNAGEPSDQTHILVSFVYKAAFNLYRYGYAAALSMIIFFILLIFSLVFMRRTKATEGAY